MDEGLRRGSKYPAAAFLPHRQRGADAADDCDRHLGCRQTVLDQEAQIYFRDP